MFAEPLKLTPLIVRIFSRTVAFAAVPEVSWLPPVLTPGKLMLLSPLNETPPIVRATAKAVAVAALPVQDPEELAVSALPLNVPLMVTSKASMVPSPSNFQPALPYT
jgi:hypothetical protein